MTAQLQRDVEAALGQPVRELRAIAGGDINDAYAARLADGQRVFVKTRAQVPAGTYAREAEGLQWLAEARGLRVPEVRAVRDALLVLEWIEPGTRVRDFDEQLGRGLARVHLAGAPSFGFEGDNFIGSLPQANDARPRWSAFYRDQRLEPLLSRAAQRGLIDRALHGGFDRLFAELDALVGPDEPPARLHGDLWSGNVHVDEHGAPVLIDPAVYGGHREVDLAMLALFGAPSARFFAAYDEVYPRAPGHAERVALYQLYPLLVHVCLFGSSYLSQLRRTLERARSS